MSNVHVPAEFIPEVGEMNVVEAEGPLQPLLAEDGSTPITEEQLLAEAEQKFNPVETAAQLFHVYMPQYKNLVKRLSNRARGRVLQALIEVPLNDKPYNHPTEEEQTAFLIGTQLLQARWVMQLHTLKEKEDERRAAENALKNDSGNDKVEETKGDTNE